MAAANDAATACGIGSLVPRARAIAPATSGMASWAGPMICASSTQTTPSGKSPATTSATARASRVLPTPPGPLNVTRRACAERSACVMAATSRSRPMSRVGGRGGEENRPRSPPAAAVSAIGRTSGDEGSAWAAA